MCCYARCGVHCSRDPLRVMYRRKRVPSFPFCFDPSPQSYFLWLYSFSLPSRDGPVTFTHRAGVTTRSEQWKTAASALEQRRELRLNRTSDHTDSDSPPQYVQHHVRYSANTGTRCECLLLLARRWPTGSHVNLTLELSDSKGLIGSVRKVNSRIPSEIELSWATPMGLFAIFMSYLARISHLMKYFKGNENILGILRTDWCII